MYMGLWEKGKYTNIIAFCRLQARDNYLYYFETNFMNDNRYQMRKNATNFKTIESSLQIIIKQATAELLNSE